MSILNINFMSQILSGPIDISVIVPNPPVFGNNAEEFYSSGRKYRVLWLLHGGNCDRNSWINYTNLVRFASESNLIIVMPTGLNTDFSDQPQFGDGFLMTKFFFEELMPFIYGFLPASKRREENFVAGYSMGAAAAWMFALFKPDCFGKVFPIGSAPKDYRYLESYRDLDSAAFRELALKDPKKFPAGYGNPEAGIHLKEINMITKYASVGDFLDSYEHTYDRAKEAASRKDMPQVILMCDSGEKTFQKIKEFQADTEKWECSWISFIYSDLDLSEYDFCDAVLPKILELCSV